MNVGDRIRPRGSEGPARAVVVEDGPPFTSGKACLVVRYLYGHRTVLGRPVLWHIDPRMWEVVA